MYHVTNTKGSILHALGWCCFTTLSLRTELLDFVKAAAALFSVLCTFACDNTRWLARLQPSHPFGMHAMDDDAYVGDVGGLGT
jgi:hypothetical protein